MFGVLSDDIFDLIKGTVTVTALMPSEGPVGWLLRTFITIVREGSPQE